MSGSARRLRTYTDEHVRRLRNNHTLSDGYGRHRHSYLHDTMGELAVSVSGGRKPSLLDYGCGKGRFIDEMRKLDLFGDIAGYDPGYANFEVIADQKYDLVTCLDVLDAAEKRFLDAIVADISARTSGFAIFDCLTKPPAKSGFPPHPPHYWCDLINRGMKIENVSLHFPGMAEFERVVIVARPLA